MKRFRERIVIDGYGDPIPTEPIEDDAGRWVLLEDAEKLQRSRDELVEVCKLAYRKHHMDDDSIGWRELSTILHDSLCNSIGVGEYGRFVDSILAARQVD